MADLCSVPKEAFQAYFQNCKKHWEQCIKSGGECFKGDRAQQLQRE